jgi:hypothetical protein
MPSAQVMMWDDLQGKFVGELSFRSQVILCMGHGSLTRAVFERRTLQYTTEARGFLTSLKIFLRSVLSGCGKIGLWLPWSIKFWFTTSRISSFCIRLRH